MAQKLTPEATVEFELRKSGGYWATVTYSDGRTLLLQVKESARHMRTSEYFKWTAKGLAAGGPAAFNRTRIGAVREMVRIIEHRDAQQ